MFYEFVLTANFLVFVGYWPQQNSVIVSHQGTDPTQLCVLFRHLLDPGETEGLTVR
jgi:hypothetical protein